MDKYISKVDFSDSDLINELEQIQLRGGVTAEAGDNNGECNGNCGCHLEKDKPAEH